jgi:hypothetical protein
MWSIRGYKKSINFVKRGISTEALAGAIKYVRTCSPGASNFGALGKTYKCRPSTDTQIHFSSPLFPPYNPYSSSSSLSQKIENICMFVDIICKK